MLLTFTLVVFFSSIILIFSQELIRLAKRIATIPGVRLLIPLILASWLIETWEEWGRWLLLWSQAEFHQNAQKIAELLPFQTGALHLIRIASLLILACLPAWVFWLKTKHKGLYSLPVVSYYIGIVLWITAVFLLIV